MLCLFSLSLAALFTLVCFMEYRKLNGQYENLLEKNAHYENLAMIDALTQIPNRRFLDDIYTKLYKEHIRDNTNLAVFMIDIDCFKAYNDFYGHVKGDEVLIQIAKTLQKTLKRPSDFIARYGGEEFVVLLKDISLDGASTMANQLILAIKLLQIPHEKSKTIPYITISIGIAFKDAAAKVTQAELLAYADKALYKAKESGKNGYVVCEKVI
ncbi:GGDEF domain-containing protein [Sulfurimonas sp.]|uniref:GGDEF domain-containing protein n=2 Tax=Sulfurimonas sp. TaxID=2022749 RepID=UPI00261ECA39|nr:GGDEF domain-containing protein [Sulfurimonas sp.]